ncbi:7-cyano-7-deazaguanine synthase [Rahnella aceris]
MTAKTGIILSGGMDSSCLAWWLKPQIAITIDYGQKAAKAEFESSALICDALGIEHHFIKVDCRELGSGDMAGKMSNTYAPASDWWPYRNQLLITISAMKAISLGVNKLLIGSVKSDSIHKDGSINFVEKISGLLNLQEGELEVKAPGIELSTLELIEKSGMPIELLLLTHSCHKDIVPCNNCRGCNKHNEILDHLGQY